MVGLLGDHLWPHRVWSASAGRGRHHRRHGLRSADSAGHELRLAPHCGGAQSPASAGRNHLCHRASALWHGRGSLARATTTGLHWPFESGSTPVRVANTCLVKTRRPSPL